MGEREREEGEEGEEREVGERGRGGGISKCEEVTAMV